MVAKKKKKGYQKPSLSRDLGVTHTCSPRPPPPTHPQRSSPCTEGGRDPAPGPRYFLRGRGLGVPQTVSDAPPGPHCQAARARPGLAAPLCPGTKPAAAAVRGPALPAPGLATLPGRPAAPHGRSRCGARPAGSAAPRRPRRWLPRRTAAAAPAPRASGPAASLRPAADTERRGRRPAGAQARGCAPRAAADGRRGVRGEERTRRAGGGGRRSSPSRLLKPERQLRGRGWRGRGLYGPGGGGGAPGRATDWASPRWGRAAPMWRSAAGTAASRRQRWLPGGETPAGAYLGPRENTPPPYSRPVSSSQPCY